jgi:trigger factor
MKANAERIEKNTVLLEVEIDAEHFFKALDQAYRRLVKKVNIPGFRRGRAPRVILERHIGKQALVDEAVEIVIPETYLKAVDDTGIKPVTQPELELVQAEEGKPLVFKAKVVVEPEVKLGQYTELEVTRPEINITGEDVLKELARLQDRHAKLVTLEEGKVEKGDLITIDYQGRINGEPFAGGEGTGRIIEAGSGVFFPDLENEIIGMSLGETREVALKFPADQSREELAGKDAVFVITVREIKRKEFSPLDDEFAKDISEFETLEELKAELQNKLKKAAEEKAEVEIRHTLLEKAVENAQLEIPEEMIARRIEEMMKETEQRLRFQNISLESYLKYLGVSLAEMKEQFRPEAQKNLKTSLVLEAIAGQEGLFPGEEEIQAEIEVFSRQINQDVEDVRKTLENKGQLAGITKRLQVNKTLQFLVDKAKIIEDNKNGEAEEKT